MTTSEPTTGEIARDLRRCFNEKSFGCVDCACRISSVEHFCDYDKMADRLESQEQTIADLRETLRITCENWSESSNEKNVQIAALTARAEQAEKERDAAIEHVHDAIFGTNHSCFYCTMENCDGCTNSTVKEHFKYRGLAPQMYLFRNEGDTK